MASSLSESRVDHRGERLRDGVYALVEPSGEVVRGRTGELGARHRS
jgi:hypothetical protein